MWRNTRSDWGIISIALHWLSALTVVGLFALGWWMTDLGYFDSLYNLAPWWHRSVGMLLLFATLLRLIWRYMNPMPEAHGSRIERLAAHFGHIMLYVLMLLVMTSGYLISTAKGAGISVFGWFDVPALISHLPNQESIAGEVHWYASLALMVMAAGHVMAALKHHFLDRNDTLTRMLNPVRSRCPEGVPYRLDSRDL